MSSSESMEMYLETIYILESNHGHAHGVDIAKALNVSKASVSKTMNQLKAKGLIEKEAYGTITLTNEGIKLSKKIYNNHKMITLFLESSLGLSNKDASENACRIEHVMNENMVNGIKRYLEENNIEL